VWAAVKGGQLYSISQLSFSSAHFTALFNKAAMAALQSIMISDFWTLFSMFCTPAFSGDQRI
jgi:hypothetical protein